MKETPWAVICPAHERVFLTESQYNAQIMRPNDRWTCPICGKVSDWDDDTFERYLDRQVPFAR